MNGPGSLSRSVAIWNELRKQLVDHYGLADDDPALIDTLDGMADLQDRQRRMIRAAREREAHVLGLDVYIRELTERRDRLENAAKGLRKGVAFSMAETGTRKLKAQDFSVTVRDGQPPVIVTDVYALPDHFCKTERKPKKVELRVALEAGEEVPGAVLGNPAPVLTVHGK